MSPRDGGALLSTHAPAQFRGGGLATVCPLRDAIRGNSFPEEPGSRALRDAVGPLGKLDGEDLVCLDVVQDCVRAEVDELAQFGWRVERLRQLQRRTSSGRSTSSANFGISRLPKLGKRRAGQVGTHVLVRGDSLPEHLVKDPALAQNERHALLLIRTDTS